MTDISWIPVGVHRRRAFLPPSKLNMNSAEKIPTRAELERTNNRLQGRYTYQCGGCGFLHRPTHIAYYGSLEWERCPQCQTMNLVRTKTGVVERFRRPPGMS